MIDTDFLLEIHREVGEDIDKDSEMLLKHKKMVGNKTLACWCVAYYKCKT